MAIFRHGLIGELAVREFDHGERSETLRRLSEQRVRAPGSNMTRRYSIATLERLPFHHRDPFDRLLAAQALEREFSATLRINAGLNPRRPCVLLFSGLGIGCCAHFLRGARELRRSAAQAAATADGNRPKCQRSTWARRLLEGEHYAER